MTYDALLCPTPKWIEAAHQTEPCTCPDGPDPEFWAGGMFLGSCCDGSGQRPVSPPSFTVTEEPSKGDKVGIVVRQVRTVANDGSHYEWIDMPHSSWEMDERWAVVGRSDIAAVEPGRLDRWARVRGVEDGKLHWTRKCPSWRVLLAPVVWLNPPEWIDP